MARLPKLTNDPIPAKAIRLSEAYRRIFDALSANPTIIKPLLEEYALDWKEDLEKIEQRFRREAAANAFFRCHLMWGEMIYGENLYALVRDPDSGLILQLNPGGWGLGSRQPVRSFGQSSGSPYDLITTGLDSDHVIDPYDECYPCPEGTYIGGAHRPVFFWRDDFERWFQKTFGAHPYKRRGRKPGSGSFEHTDRPFLREMHGLMETRAATSVEYAAGQVAERAPGASFESKRTRLAKRYRKLYSSERN